MSEKNIINDEQMSGIAGGYDRIQNSNFCPRCRNAVYFVNEEIIHGKEHKK